MSAANIGSDGKVRQLDGRAGPDIVVTADDVQDASKLARMVQEVARKVAQLLRVWRPRRIDFEGVTCGTGGALIQLHHGFGGAVRWWVVDWQLGGPSGGPNLQRWTTTDANTLVLWSDKLGTATIRVEEAGS